MSEPRLILSTAPFVHEHKGTARVMAEVAIAAMIVAGVATWHFGLGALLVVLAAVVGAVGTEWMAHRGAEHSPLTDWSAALTGLLLGLTLPPSLPLWMAFLGGVVAISLGKLIWGGLGQNAFNPALVGRAFLQAAFPTSLTTWADPAAPGHISASLFAAPLSGPSVDVISSATPLGMAKFEDTATPLLDLLWGQTAGSIGETHAVLLIILGLVLGARRIFDWRLPVSTLLSVLVFAGLAKLIDPSLPGPLAMLLSGGLLLAAVFMVTDPVTTPTTKAGAWAFGLGVGFLVVLIRAWGGLPEGVMYAVLLMNAVSPHLERFTQPKPFGARA
jgi:Na+-translocating ferredoxin:NAD+ oxidoreductase subunit D